MTEHPGDNVDNRFRAFWAGALAFLAFGIVLMLALKLFGAGSNDSAMAEPPLTDVDREIIATRLANREAVETAQSALVPKDKLKSAKAAAIAALSAKKPTPSEVPLVPVVAPAPAPDAAAGEGGEKADAPGAEGEAKTEGAGEKEPAAETPEN